MPGSIKVAGVTALPGAAKLTEPGPEIFVQVVTSVLPRGSPSSLAVPFRLTTSVGSVMVWSGPASAAGGRLIGGGATSVSVICKTPLP